jgi:hypothetical protein
MPLSFRSPREMGNHMLKHLADSRTKDFRDRLADLHAGPLFTRRELTAMAVFSGILSAVVVIVA